jgi:protease YdgD
MCRRSIDRAAAPAGCFAPWAVGSGPLRVIASGALRGLAVGLALWGAGPAADARDLLPGVIGTDDRRIVDVAQAPWAAVGQVNIARYRRMSQCTGTLIAPNRVMTAAHCVTDASTGKLVPLHAIHFLTGVFGARWTEHAQPKCVVLPETRRQRAVSPPKRPPKGQPLAWFVDDFALLILDRPLKAQPMPVADNVGADSYLGPLHHAAFAADRRYRLTAHLGCALRTRTRDGLWLTDCDTHHATSGGPVLVEQGDGFRLAAIMVGGAEKRFSIAVPALIWRDIVGRASCPTAKIGRD